MSPERRIWIINLRKTLAGTPSSLMVKASLASRFLIFRTCFNNSPHNYRGFVSSEFRHPQMPL